MRPVRPRRLAWTDYRPAEVLAFIDARTVESLRPGFESQRGRPPGTRQVPARSHQSERPEFFWQISVRHVVEAVLRERLLLRLLVDLQHRLDFVPPELVVEPGVRHLGVERTDVSRRERVRGEIIIQDVARGDSHEFGGRRREVLGYVCCLDSAVRDGRMDPERPGIPVRVVQAERSHSSKKCLYPRDLKIIDVLCGGSNLHDSTNGQNGDSLFDQAPQEVQSFALPFRYVVQEPAKNRVGDSLAAPIKVAESPGALSLIEPADDPP